MTRGRKVESKRVRRAFSPEFKVEAVRLMRERRAAGVSLAQAARRPWKLPRALAKYLLSPVKLRTSQRPRYPTVNTYSEKLSSRTIAALKSVQDPSAKPV
jgi:hypothetical protein